MIDQLDLFDQPKDPHTRARRGDPDTSRAAAESVDKVGITRRRILELLRENPGGLTDDEIALRAYADRWFTSPSGMRTRRSELVELGAVVDSGDRRRLASGRYAVIWKAVA